jgi:hypothetical protein
MRSSAIQSATAAPMNESTEAGACHIRPMLAVICDLGVGGIPD